MRFIYSKAVGIARKVSNSGMPIPRTFLSERAAIFRYPQCKTGLAGLAAWFDSTKIQKEIPMKRLVNPSMMAVVVAAALALMWPALGVKAFNPQPDPPAFGLIGINPYETARLNSRTSDLFGSHWRTRGGELLSA